MAAGNKSRMTLISKEAKKIYKPGKMDWTDAIKKAANKLKKEKKI